MKTETLIRRIFSDSRNLKIITKNDVIQEISGIATFSYATFRMTIKLKPRGYPYRGIISLVDPRTNRVLQSEMRRRELASKEVSSNNTRAAKDFRCTGTSPDALATGIKKTMLSLLSDNREQLEKHLREAYTPDTITPALAGILYAADFVAANYANSKSKKNKQRVKLIQNHYSAMPARPMAEIKEQEILTFSRKDKWTPETYALLGLFWSHCISRQICYGTTPFTADHKRRQESVETKNRKATTADRLSEAQCKEFFRLINLALDTGYCAVSLILSGFDTKFVTEVTFGDLSINPNYDDYVVVRYFQHEIVGYKHDFSRPLLPEVARYVSRIYSEFLKNNDEEEIKTWYVATGSATPIGEDELRAAAYNLLVRAGVDPSALLSTRGAAMTRPEKMLLSTYRHQLEITCGLASDPDSLAFLTGSLLYSSTYTAYEEHADAAANDRFYALLLPTSIERKINRKDKVTSTDCRSTYSFWPTTTHAQLTLNARFILMPGEEFSLACAHGVFGQCAAATIEEKGEDQAIQCFEHEKTISSTDVDPFAKKTSPNEDNF